MKTHQACDPAVDIKKPLPGEMQRLIQNKIWGLLHPQLVILTRYGIADGNHAGMDDYPPGSLECHRLVLGILRSWAIAGPPNKIFLQQISPYVKLFTTGVICIITFGESPANTTSAAHPMERVFSVLFEDVGIKYRHMHNPPGIEHHT